MVELIEIVSRIVILCACADCDNLTIASGVRHLVRVRVVQLLPAQGA